MNAVLMEVILKTFQNTKTTSTSLLYFRSYKKKESRLKKYPNLVKQTKRNRKKKAFVIKNIDDVVRELNSINSPVLYVDLLYRTLRERNKSLLRSVVDEIGMPECTKLLREVALIQENGGLWVIV